MDHRPSSIDIENADDLAAYLRLKGYVAPGEQLAFKPLSGGVSNRTILLTRAGGDQWVIKQALDKLRVQVAWYSDPARIHQEALALRWLPKVTPEGTTPALIFEDEAAHILAMEAIPLPHANWKNLLLAGEAHGDHIAQFARILGVLHRQSTQQQSFFRDVFHERAFFESLRLEPYYRYTAQQHPSAQKFYDALISDTRAVQAALVHGDYSPKNILVYAGRLILLDHEVIHFGDPAFDSGFAMTHLLSKAHHLEPYRQTFVKAAITFWRIYWEQVSDLEWAGQLEARAVRHALGCLLARVDGRSPLEYLTPSQRERQRQVVLHQMQHPPVSVNELVEQFTQGIGTIDNGRHHPSSRD